MIRNLLRGALALACAASLGGCGLFGHHAEPDALALWTAEHATLLTPEPAGGADLQGFRVQHTPDGHGYALTPVEKGSTPPLRYYFVPVSAVDDALDAKLRKAVFPGGVATLTPNEENAPPLRFAETELDGFYLRMLITDRSSSCDKFKRICDAVGDIALVGKLRGAPLLGKGKKLLKIDIAELATGPLTAKDLPDAAKTCGFDPDRDRLPSHIATACQRIRLIDWALDNGFTLDPSHQLLPLTPDALKVMLRALPDSFYVTKQLRGTIEEDK
jgi:hypothetical protein